VCGEQRKGMDYEFTLMGSPPRVRGTAGGTLSPRIHIGITPACAGNSHKPPPSASVCEDHPRVCGEQMPASAQPLARPGSPPRVRGTVQSTTRGREKSRITPACAGNSVERWTS